MIQLLNFDLLAVRKRPVDLSENQLGFKNKAVLGLSYKSEESIVMDEDDLLSDENDSSRAQIMFSGDINGDGFPDFLISAGPSYRFSVTTLLLSTKVSKKPSYEKIVFTDTGGPKC